MTEHIFSLKAVFLMLVFFFSQELLFSYQLLFHLPSDDDPSRAVSMSNVLVVLFLYFSSPSTDPSLLKIL